MLKLFFDTETTGVPVWKELSESPEQPHLVQLAALLVDTEKRATVQSMDVIIRPDGWVIPEDVSEIHGITHERAMDVGISEELAVQMLMELWGERPRVAHNEPFDARIIRIALKRYSNDDVIDAWKEGERECTARLSSPIVNLPPTPAMVKSGKRWPKTPKLSEAYEFFMGMPLENAHSAMADTMACLQVYDAIRDWNSDAA